MNYLEILVDKNTDFYVETDNGISLILLYNDTEICLEFKDIGTAVEITQYLSDTIKDVVSEIMEK